MLRVQKVCGKSRGGASVPLCVKLQGAVACGRPKNNGTGFTCPSESLKRSNTPDNQPLSSLNSSVCKSEGSNPEEPSSGNVFSLKDTMLDQRGIKKTLNIFSGETGALSTVLVILLKH